MLVRLGRIVLTQTRPASEEAGCVVLDNASPRMSEINREMNAVAHTWSKSPCHGYLRPSLEAASAKLVRH